MRDTDYIFLRDRNTSFPGSTVKEIPAGSRSVSEALECVGPEDDMEMPKENGQSDRHSCSSYCKS